ncbi:MAG: CehA/McbA family metallohydrolase [Chitinispirillaceae bacterium]|nr:CehA/McbA family metallohydrolase [Chitinispirillaceae bacterium]
MVDPIKSFFSSFMIVCCLMTGLAPVLMTGCDRNPVMHRDNDSVLKTASVNGTPPVIGGYKVYYGDLHNHCAVSEKVGTPDEAFLYARDTAGLDFFGLSDYDWSIADTEWDELKTAADAHNEDGVYVTFIGFEWRSDDYGHVGVFNTDDYCLTSDPQTNTFSELCSWLSARNSVVFLYHPGRHKIANEFNRFTGGPYEYIVGIELWNRNDPFSVFYYNDGMYPDDNNKSYFDEALSRGWKLGAAGGGDNHTGTWGTLTDSRLAVLAENLTRTDILSALRARRFYSTLDKNLVLSFKIGNAEMGSTIPGARYQVEVQAFDANNEEFTNVTLFNCSHDIERKWDLATATVMIADSIETFDGNYFYVKVRQTDGDEAISSPVWISGGRVNAPPSCTVTAPVDEAVFNSPASFAVTADAADTDGSITCVAFMLDGSVIGVDSAAPYQASLTDIATGSYSLKARAYDNQYAATTSKPVTVIVRYPEGTQTVDRRIAAGADDAEENRAGKVSLTSSDLELADDADPQSVGLHFTGCGIPPGSAINIATLQFTCDETSDEPTVVSISGENADNAAPFTNTTGNISGRTSTAAAVSWTIPAWLAADEAGINQRTPDLKTIIQEIVNRSGYTTESSLVFILSGGGSRIAQSYETSSEHAPLLHVEYVPNNPPACSITAPDNGATFTAPAEVTIIASAHDSDGTVTGVEFFVNGKSAGRDSDAPFSCILKDGAAGPYVITAVAADNAGESVTSAPVVITVNAPPTCSITAPTSGYTFIAPADVSISASASDSFGTVEEVELFVNGKKAGSAADAPYVFRLKDLEAGSYAVTAVATDSDGATDTSTVVPFTVIALNKPPVCAVTAPEANALFFSPAVVTIEAAPRDSDGTVTGVEFFVNGSRAGSDTAAPFSLTLDTLFEGTYAVYAVATDDDGDRSASPAIQFSVRLPPNSKPFCAIFSPEGDNTFRAPCDLKVGVTATDADGRVAKVAFLVNGRNIGEIHHVPFIFGLTDLDSGQYSIAAVATDDEGSSDTSETVFVTVKKTMTTGITHERDDDNGSNTVPVPGEQTTPSSPPAADRGSLCPVVTTAARKTYGTQVKSAASLIIPLPLPASGNRCSPTIADTNNSVQTRSPVDGVKQCRTPRYRRLSITRLTLLQKCPRWMFRWLLRSRIRHAESVDG